MSSARFFFLFYSHQWRRRLKTLGSKFLSPDLLCDYPLLMLLFLLRFVESIGESTEDTSRSSLVMIILGHRRRVQRNILPLLLLLLKNLNYWLGEIEWVRGMFINLFEDKRSHVNRNSSPVVPLNDPTLLFTNNEFMPGGSLYEYLHKNHIMMELPQLAKFAIDVCRRMEYLHQNNIIHRDLKTANLLMDADQNSKAPLPRSTMQGTSKLV